MKLPQAKQSQPWPRVWLFLNCQLDSAEAQGWGVGWVQSDGSALGSPLPCCHTFHQQGNQPGSKCKLQFLDAQLQI